MKGVQEGVPWVPGAAKTHFPSFPATLQAPHAPLHAASQHTPSTQWPLRHALITVQGAAGGFFGTHPVPSQYWPEAHWVSSRQVAGQVAEVPVQVNGAQLGLPADPAGTDVQLPFAPARLHAWQAPVQAVSQHTLSTQLPLTQALAPLQAAPGISRGAQPEPLQYWPVAHWVSRVQLEGQLAAAPSHR